MGLTLKSGISKIAMIMIKAMKEADNGGEKENKEDGGKKLIMSRMASTGPWDMVTFN